MSRVTKAVRNTLAQDEVLTSMLAKSKTFDAWVFADRPPGVQFESKGVCLIVITEADTWTTMNEYNTQKFPRIYVDVWADSDRNPDGTVRVNNTTDKIEAIIDQVDKTLHMVNRSDANGMPIVFGTKTQIENRTGIRVITSTRQGGISYSDIPNAPDACMGRVQYNLSIG